MIRPKNGQLCQRCGGYVFTRRRGAAALGSVLAVHEQTCPANNPSSKKEK